MRAQVVAALRNVHEDLATAVADGLGLAELPEPARCAREPITDPAPSPALSIVRNGPDSIAGRKIGVLVTDGVDAEALAEVREAVQAEKAILEIVAPKVGGVTTEDGKTVEADQKIDGGPSVLYDAVVILASEAGAAELATVPPARDFVSDAYAHGKFIVHRNAGALFAAAGLTGELDAGVMDLAAGASVADFLGRCREVRYWARFEG
ncbi:hypothetical protein [Nocardia nova]|uniref:hypothetical protein n=1 Tax=Nocardia nova TaxID=37330 RepID=UPI0034DEE793